MGSRKRCDSHLEILGITGLEQHILKSSLQTLSRLKKHATVLPQTRQVTSSHVVPMAARLPRRRAHCAGELLTVPA